jgi:hypothetical protein
MREKFPLSDTVYQAPKTCLWKKNAQIFNTVEPVVSRASSAL